MTFQPNHLRNLLARQLADAALAEIDRRCDGTEDGREAVIAAIDFAPARTVLLGLETQHPRLDAVIEVADALGLTVEVKAPVPA